MSDYKRLTDEDWLTTISVNDTNDAKLIEYAFRLWQLENQIKNGTLVELPCKVGDTVYTVEYSHYYNHWFIDEHEITEIIIDKNNVYLEDWYGVYVWEPFLTKAEAEAKLEELKRGQE